MMTLLQELNDNKSDEGTCPLSVVSNPKILWLKEYNLYLDVWDDITKGLWLHKFQTLVHSWAQFKMVTCPLIIGWWSSSYHGCFCFKWVPVFICRNHLVDKIRLICLFSRHFILILQVLFWGAKLLIQNNHHKRIFQLDIVKKSMALPAVDKGKNKYVACIKYKSLDNNESLRMSCNEIKSKKP